MGALSVDMARRPIKPSLAAAAMSPMHSGNRRASDALTSTCIPEALHKAVSLVRKGALAHTEPVFTFSEVTRSRITRARWRRPVTRSQEAGAPARVVVVAAALLVAAGICVIAPVSAAASGSVAGPVRTDSMPACSTTAAISYGEAPQVADIATAGEIDCFTFSGTSGDLEFTNLDVTSGSVSPFIDIFKPDGTSDCGGPYEGPGGCPLDETGTWTIELSDSDGTHTGSMNVAINKVNSAVGCKNLPFGPTTVKGKVKTVAAISCFTFSGSSGDVVYVHVVGVKGALGTPEVTLGSPDASEPCGSAETGTLECPLTDTGTQSLLLYADRGAVTGKFNISIQRLTKPVQCPTLVKKGASNASSIATIGQVRCFELAGKSGEKITATLTGVTGTLGPLMDLFDPAGTSVAAGPGETLSYTLNSAGSWVILIEDSAGPGLGNFTIALT